MANVKVPALLHKMSVSSQKAWYKKQGMELPTHLKPVSAAQAKKADKPTNTKELENKSLKAYGATKGTKVGEIGGEKAGADKDTIAPLSPQQHSKVQAAIKAAKGTTTTKRPPIKSKEDRLAFIRSAVAKAKSPKRAERFDVATIDNNDAHDNVRRDNDLMHSVGVRHSYNESTDRIAMIKSIASKNPKNAQPVKPAALTKKPMSVRSLLSLHKQHSFYGDFDYTEKKKKNLGSNKFEEAGQIDEANQPHKVGDLVSYFHQGLGDHLYGVVKSVGDKHITMKTGNQTRAVPIDMVHKADKNKVPKYRYESVEQISEKSSGEQKMSLAQKLAQQAMKTKKETPGADVPADKQIAQQMGEEVIKEDDDAREYDYEGEMAKNQLKGIMMHAEKLHDMLDDDTNLPEWVQAKITLAADYVQTAADYMQADSEDLDEEVEQIDELKSSTYASVATKRAAQAKAALKDKDYEGYAGKMKKSGKAADASVPKKGWSKEEDEQIHEKYMGFKALKASIAAKGGARDPGAVAAAIGRKKYGKAAFQKAAAKGEKMDEALLDPVGKEDKDVNNDGKSDGTDKYLLNRRTAVAQAIKSKMAKKLGK